MNIRFLGAAMTVTGSCHLIETDKYKILLDCGQFQGSRAVEELNYKLFDFDPAEIDFVILTHAHIDHCGRLPLLIKHGFPGRIYCTAATADLADIMLQDAGRIHESDAYISNKRSRRAGRREIEPLYTEQEAAKTARHFYPVQYDRTVKINNEISLRMTDAGHILGAAFVELWVNEGGKQSKIVFSGDIGVRNKPLLRDPQLIEQADYVIMETTYGDRLHESFADSMKSFIEIVLKTLRRDGTVVIPSFALGRTQELIYAFNRFYEDRTEYRDELRDVKVYVDSPLAANATSIFKKHKELFDEDAKKRLSQGDDPLVFHNLIITKSTEESKQINFDRSPKIIISASGMCDAGRIRHHLKHNLWNPSASIIFVGYQAKGSLGRAIVDGEKDVTIFDENIHVNAEVYMLEGFSAHADRDDLIYWLRGFKSKPKKIFLVHGEEQSKYAFAETVKDQLGLSCTVIEEASNYDTERDTLVSLNEDRRTVDAGRSIVSVRDTLSSIRNEFEGLLCGPELHYVSAQNLEEFNSGIAELKKDANKLKALLEHERQNTQSR